jgi:nitrogen regulatory protein PII-like uncharacterized protein
MPADNNITERGNHTDKDNLKHKKCHPLKFIELTVMKLSNESSTQLDYHGRMKQRVHSSKFMEAVFMTLEGNQNGRPCLLNMQVPFTSVQHQIPPPSFLVPKHWFLDLYKEHSVDISKDNAVDDMMAMMHPRPGRGFSFTRFYNYMAVNPDGWLKEVEEDEDCESVFKAIMEWTSRFCCIRPIDPNDSYDSWNAVVTLQTVLDSNGYDIMECKEIVELDLDNGLVSCDCWTYLHYAWCYHSCSIAFSRGIIKCFPTKLDPRPLFKASQKGCPSTAKKGGVLCHI